MGLRRSPRRSSSSRSSALFAAGSRETVFTPAEELANLTEQVYAQAVADGLGKERTINESERATADAEQKDVEAEIDEAKRKLEESHGANKTDPFVPLLQNSRRKSGDLRGTGRGRAAIVCISPLQTTRGLLRSTSFAKRPYGLDLARSPVALVQLTCVGDTPINLFASTMDPRGATTVTNWRCQAVTTFGRLSSRDAPCPNESLTQRNTRHGHVMQQR